MQGNDFEDFSGNSEASPAKTDAKNDGNEKKPYHNTLNSFDSLTTGNGYISEVRQHGEYIFVNVGLMTGRIKNNESGEYKTHFQNVDLLCGATAAKTFKLLVGKYNKEDGGFLFGKVQIRNLVHLISEPDEQGKTYLNSKGILETFQIGRLD